MAIYGDFEYHAFSDIIKVLQRHNGVLFMRTALAGRSVELHLKEGTLGAMFIDGFPVNEPLRVNDTIRTLVNGARGEYSFEAGPTQHSLHIPIGDLIRDVLSTADIAEQHLPHQDTRFEWNTHGAPAHIPDSLRPSWDSVSPLLRYGGSASDVANQLRISVHEARIVLYRLRAAGLIAPARAGGLFQSRPAEPPAPAYGSPQGGGVQLHDPRFPVVPPPAQPQQQAGPVRRLLNALRRLTGGSA